MGSDNKIRICSFLLASIFCTGNGIQAQDHSIPGEINTLFPTVRNLAVEWDIQGDDNLNGRVEVAYREIGTKAWIEGMSLFRVPAGENIGFTWNNKHSGSIFDLDPDTGYEIWLRLSDPDGGAEERRVNARTRDGLTIINLDEKGIAIQLNGSENCVISGCTINAIYGIVAYLPGATNCYISDNVVTGICEWSSRAMGSNGDNIGEGIQLTGPEMLSVITGYPGSGIASPPWKTAMSTTRHALTYIIMIYTGQQMMPSRQIFASQIAGSFETVSPIATSDSAPNPDWAAQIILSEMPCTI
jgi:hypothetical protein